MADSNLHNLLASTKAALAQVQQSANPASASAVKQWTPPFIQSPVTAIAQGDRLKIIDSVQRLLGHINPQQLSEPPAYAGSHINGKQIVLLSAPKTLFDALLSANQQAVLLKAISQNPTSLQTLQTSIDTLPPLKATVVAITANRVTVELNPPIADLKQISLPLPKALKQLQAGEQLSLKIEVVNKQWQVRIITNQSRSTPPVQPDTVLRDNKPLSQVSNPKDTVGYPPAVSKLSNQHPIIDKVILRLIQSGTVVQPNQALINAIQTWSPTDAKAVVQPLLSNPAVAKQLLLSSASDNRIKTQVLAQIPLAIIPTSNESNPQQEGVNLQKLPLPQWQQMAKFVGQSSATSSNIQHQFKLMPPADPEMLNLITQNHRIPLDTDIPITTKTTQTSTSSSVILQQLQSLIKTSYTQSATNSETAKALQSVLEQLNKSTEPTLKATSNNLAQALSPLLAAKQPDPAQIQALLQLPTIPFTATSISPIASSNSLISGLISLLQLSVGSRLSKVPTANLERVQTALGQLLTTTASQASLAPAAGPVNQAKTLQEFAQIESRQQLLKTLSKLINQHQYNKLSGSEATLQGQDSLFYSLPSYSPNSNRDIELMIRREPESKNKSKPEQQNRSAWQLTMLLEVGDKGEMLAKCWLKEAEVKLDIYTSNESLRNTVLDFLPLLKKRLTDFGLEVLSSQCQLGKMPESLRPKPYQIFETKA